jgi:hypothetical protein
MNLWVIGAKQLAPPKSRFHLLRRTRADELSELLGQKIKEVTAMCGRWRSLACILSAVLLIVLLALVAGCGKGKTTIVQITNKITSLPAGQTYQFTADVEHDQQMGVKLSLTGAGTLVLTGETATYLAPPAPPTPNSVTVTVTAGNGSGVSDSDTFTITSAAGPVVSISPTQPTVSVSAGTPVTLNIAVTQDDPSDLLTAGVSSSSTCGGDICGSFGAISGTAGSGVYTVQFYPPSSVTTSTLQTINVISSLSDSTMGTAFVIINP